MEFLVSQLMKVAALFPLIKTFQIRMRSLLKNLDRYFDL